MASSSDLDVTRYVIELSREQYFQIKNVLDMMGIKNEHIKRIEKGQGYYCLVFDDTITGVFEDMRAVVGAKKVEDGIMNTIGNSYNQMLEKMEIPTDYLH